MSNLNTCFDCQKYSCDGCPNLEPEPKCKLCGDTGLYYQKNPDCEFSCPCTKEDCDGYGGNTCCTPTKCDCGTKKGDKIK